MEAIYDTVESIVMWVIVVFAVGLVCYLGYRQYLKMKYRRARRRHHARRAKRQARWRAEPPQPDHDQPARSADPGGP